MGSGSSGRPPTARRRPHLPVLVVGAIAAGVVVALAVGLVVALAGRPSPPAAAPRSTLGNDLPRPTPSKPMTVAFIGDSYTEGWFASAPERGWAELVAVEQGWRGVNLGQAGTGYTATPRAGACGARPCRTYPDTVPVAARARPSALVIAGGVNDFATFRDRPADEIAAIRTTFTKARQALPRAIILGVGPVTPYGVDPRVRAFAAAVREAVEGVGGRYVSMIDPDVLKGGDRSLIVSDGLHPNDAGHAAIAARFTEQVRPDGTLRR